MTSENEGNETQGHGADGEGNPPPPPPPAISGNGVKKPDNGQHHGGDGAHKGRWFPKNIKPAEWVMIAFTAVTAIAAWAGVWVANGQLTAMLDSSYQTDRAIAESHRLGDTAADAIGVAVYARNTQKESADTALALAKRESAGILAKAQEANRIAHDSLTVIQRAFVVVDELRRTPVEIAGQPNAVLFTPIIQNSGNTPATIVEYIAIAPSTEFSLLRPEVLRQHLEEEFRIMSPFDPADILNYVGERRSPVIVRNLNLGPKGIIAPPEGEGAEIIDAGKTLASQGSSRIGRFFFGEIRYLDIFNAPHVTKYCFAIDKFESINGVYRPEDASRCRHWNCADAQCKADREEYDKELANLTPPTVPKPH